MNIKRISNKKTSRFSILSLILAITALFCTLTVYAANEPNEVSQTHNTENGSASCTMFLYDKESKKISIVVKKVNNTPSDKYYIHLFELDENGKAVLKKKHIQKEPVENLTERTFMVDNLEVSQNEYVEVYNEFVKGKTKLNLTSNNNDESTVYTDYHTGFRSETAFADQYTSDGTNDLKVKMSRGNKTKLFSGIKLNDEDIRSGLYEIEWKSNDENVASVDENGAVTALNSGICRVTALINGVDVPTAEYLIVVE